MLRGLGAPAAGVVLLASSVLGACGDDGGSEATSSEGSAVFVKAGCGSCHTLSDAGSSGTVGPDLDALAPNALVVAQTVRNGSGQMPSFRAQLTDDEIQAVAAYVQEATGAEPVEE